VVQYFPIIKKCRGHEKYNLKICNLRLSEEFEILRLIESYLTPIVTSTEFVDFICALRKGSITKVEQVKQIE